MSQPESLPKPADSVGQPIEDPAKRAAQRATHAFWQDAYSQQPPKGAVVDASVKHPSDALPIAMPWNASGMPITDYKIVFGDASKFGLTWNDEKHKGLATGFTEASIGKGRALKAKVDAEDPGVKELMEIRYRDAPPDWLPQNSPWWKREGGKVEPGYENVYNKLDFGNPQFQDQVVKQAVAAVQSGAVDGIMLDWYKPGVGGPKDDEARLALIDKLRAAIGPKALIIINTNNAEAPPEITKQVNGYYMECTKSTTPADMQKIEHSLDYAEQNTLSPHINILETWPDAGHGREELNKMRATAALLLTHAPDGALLFADPDGAKDGDHGHDFYAFYNTRLGKPVGKMVKRADGSEARAFEHGLVVYNPVGNGKRVELKFAQPRQQASTGDKGSNFVVPAGDGDIFLQ